MPTQKIQKKQIFVSCILFHLHTSLALFPHGAELGDIIIIDSKNHVNRLTEGDTDDGLKVINVPNFPFFDKKVNNKIQLSTNGFILLGNEEVFNSATPTDFPINYQGKTLPIIAAFWTDLYFYNNSIFSYQIHTAGDVINKVHKFVIKQYPEEHFLATHALVITWYNIHHKLKIATDSFTFQLVLVTDGKSTHVIFSYDCLPKNVSAVVGFQENLNIYRFEHSLEKEAGYYLLNSSNVDMYGVHVYKIANEVLDCSNLPDGANEHLSDCQKYIICQNEQVSEVKQCNNSDHFHPVYKFCVPASQYPCHQNISQVCVGKNEETVADETDCSKMVFCRAGKVEKVTMCPNGTNFHPILKVCVFKEQYPCVNGSTGDVPTNPCDGRSDGNYVDPKSCTNFIQCANGLHHKMECPAGLHFNQGGPPGSLGFCDWPFNVGCTLAQIDE